MANVVYNKVNCECGVGEIKLQIKKRINQHTSNIRNNNNNKNNNNKQQVTALA